MTIQTFNNGEQLSSVRNKINTSLTNLDAELDNKQDELVSGTNIKTINSQSLLGSGNIEIQAGAGGVFYDAGSSGVATLIDWENGNIQKLEIDDDTTITFDNWQEGLTLFLQIVNGGDYAVTWDFGTDTIKWSEGTAPSLSSDSTDIVAFQKEGTRVLGDYGLNFSEE